MFKKKMKLSSQKPRRMLGKVPESASRTLSPRKSRMEKDEDPEVALSDNEKEIEMMAASSRRSQNNDGSEPVFHVTRDVSQSQPPSSYNLISHLEGGPSHSRQGEYEDEIDPEDLLFESLDAWHESLVEFAEEHHFRFWESTNQLIERHQLQHYFSCLLKLKQADSESGEKKRKFVLGVLSKSVLALQFMMSDDYAGFESSSSLTHVFTSSSSAASSSSSSSFFKHPMTPPSLKYLCVVVVLNNMPRYRTNFVTNSLDGKPQRPRHRGSSEEPLRLRDIISLRTSFLHAFGQSIHRVFSELGLSFSVDVDTPAIEEKTLAPSSPEKHAKSDGEDSDDDLVTVEYSHLTEDEREADVIRSQILPWKEGDDNTDIEIFKIVLMGPGGVGKSALLEQLMNRTFRSVYDPTVEDNYYLTMVVDGKPVRLQILDSAGQSEYIPLRSYYMSHADGFLVLFGVNSINSLFSALEFPDHIYRVKGYELDNLKKAKNKKDKKFDPFVAQGPVPIILVGTKIDLVKKRKIGKEQAMKKAEKFRCGYVEISSKTGANVLQCFEMLVRQLRETSKKVENEEEASARKQEWKQLRKKVRIRGKEDKKVEKERQRLRKKWVKKRNTQVERERKVEVERKKIETIKEAKSMQPSILIPSFIKNRQDIEVFPSQIHFVDSTAHCFCLTFPSFSSFTISAPREYYFSIWNRDSLEVLTEEFCVAIPLEEQQDIEEAGFISVPDIFQKAVFKDFFQRDMDLSSLILVCRGILIGKLQLDDVQSLSGARIPNGYGIEIVEELLSKNTENALNLDIDGVRKGRRQNRILESTAINLFQKPPVHTVKDFISILLSHTPIGHNENFERTGQVHVALEMDPLPNEHAHLGLLRRISVPPPLVIERTFPTVHATSSQSFAKNTNKLHVTILGGHFPGVPETFVTPKLAVSVRLMSGWEVENRISIGRSRAADLDEKKHAEVTCTVDQTPTNSPNWNETIQVDLDGLESTVHLYFNIEFLPTNNSWPTQHTFLKLETDEGFITDGIYRLKCFSRPAGASADPVFYLKENKPAPKRRGPPGPRRKSSAGSVHSTPREATAIPGPTPTYDDLSTQKDETETFNDGSQTSYIVIRTRLCSFERTQDKNMNAILQYKAYPPTMYSRFLDKIISEEVNSVEIFRLLPKLVTLFVNIYWLEKYQKIQDKIDEAFRVVLSYLIELMPSGGSKISKGHHKKICRGSLILERSPLENFSEGDSTPPTTPELKGGGVKLGDLDGDKKGLADPLLPMSRHKTRSRSATALPPVTTTTDVPSKSASAGKVKKHHHKRQGSKDHGNYTQLNGEKKEKKKHRKDHDNEKDRKRKGKEKEEDSGSSGGEPAPHRKRRGTKKKRDMGGMERRGSIDELSLGTSGSPRQKEKNEKKKIQALQLSKVVPVTDLKSAKKPGHKREKKMFPCLLGYTLLTFECPVQLADQARALFLRLFKEFIEKEDISVYYGKNITSKDYPTFDQYLGMLLSDWSSSTARDVVVRNQQHRTRARVERHVRFCLPSLENVRTYSIPQVDRVPFPAASPKPIGSPGTSPKQSPHVSPSPSPPYLMDRSPVNDPFGFDSELEEEDLEELEELEMEEGDLVFVDEEKFNVGEWLRSLNMGRYQGTFSRHGFDTLGDVQMLMEEDLDTMGVRVPRHRVLLMKESQCLV